MDRTLGYELRDAGSTPAIPTNGVFSLLVKYSAVNGKNRVRFPKAPYRSVA